MVEFNPSSSAHISLLLFGGKIKDSRIEPVLGEDGEPCIIKSGKNKGQVKTHKVLFERKVKGLGLEPKKAWKTAKDGVYSTKEEVLSEINNADFDVCCPNADEAIKIASCMLKIRELTKQIQTYYTGVEELIYAFDSCVHASFQHVSTDTSRLSCNKPNIQNVPTGYSNIKQHFCSRFENGRIVSADYSQLEIRIQAQLCQDQSFINDILCGIDFHIKRVALKEGRAYEEIKAEVDAGNSDTIHARSSAKAFSFARAYGAGTKKISQQTGLTEEEVQTLIENEDKAYPRLKLFNDWNLEVVNRQGWYKDPFGRRYAFKKYPSKVYWKKEESYSPTEVKNYLIQGFATGTIVPIMIGKFWRDKAIHNRHIRCEHPHKFIVRPMQWCSRCNDTGFYDKYLMINTVHDSLMLDVMPEYVENARKDLTILEDVGKLALQVFNYQFNVPIKIDLAEGETWYECK